MTKTHKGSFISKIFYVWIHMGKKRKGICLLSLSSQRGARKMCCIKSSYILLKPCNIEFGLLYSYAVLSPFYCLFRTVTEFRSY